VAGLLPQQYTASNISFLVSHSLKFANFEERFVPLLSNNPRTEPKVSRIVSKEKKEKATWIDLLNPVRFPTRSPMAVPHRRRMHPVPSCGSAFSPVSN
jgi:hypothetical protein